MSETDEYAIGVTQLPAMLPGKCSDFAMAFSTTWESKVLARS
jgi:hypothetical protein